GRAVPRLAHHPPAACRSVASYLKEEAVMAVVEASNIVRTYEEKGMPPATALRGVSLSVEKGEFMALAGPSGSGKTTLLNIIGGIDAATSGEVKVDGRSLGGLSRNELADLRRD